MGDYRAYLIGDDGHIVRSVAMVLDDEAVAIETAKSLVDGHDVELWERARLVGIYKHGKDADP